MTGLSDQTVLLPGEPPVSVVLRFSRRARRLSLRVSRLDGRVTLTVPHKMKRDEVMAFATERADWVRGHLAQTVQSEHVGLGTILPIEGQEVEVLTAPIRSPRIEDGQLLIPQNARVPGATVEAFLKTLARDRLSVATERYAAALGRKITKLTLRDTRSRWGSCTSEGGLMFSWRLAMAPPAILDYVAAHEAAHLVEMNHSDAFWQVNARLCPDYQRHRAWLKTHGAALHRWKFKQD